MQPGLRGYGFLGGYVDRRNLMAGVADDAALVAAAQDAASNVADSVPAAPDDNDTFTYVAIGGGVLLLAGVVYLALLRR